MVDRERLRELNRAFGLYGGGMGWHCVCVATYVLYELTDRSCEMVLIVEDDPVSRRALAQLLRLNGFEAQAVGSAEEAISFMACGNSPATVLLDIDLPGMSGLDLARRLAGTHPFVIAYFVTASDDRFQSLSEDYPGRFFRKPIDIKSLLETLRCTFAA
jgi:CheY-like chemotaxis protein